MKRFQFLLLIILVFIIYSSSIKSQQYQFSGYVTTSENKPIHGAMVSIKSSEFKVMTNTKGFFRFNKLTSDNFIIEIKLLGFATLEKNINLKEGTSGNFVLDETFYRLKGVEITANKSKLIQKETPNISRVFIPKEIQYKAGGGEDVFRALLSMPGIASQNDASVQLAIRGSSPEHNLMLMDGIEILNPYRFYGTISMFNPELVNDVNLIAGSFPAKFSDRISAVLDVTCKDGFNNELNSPKFLTNFNLSNLNLIAEVKLPLKGSDSLTESDERFGSFVIGFRRTYYDLFVSPFVNKLNLIDGDFVLPNFYDFQFKFGFQTSNSNKFIFNAIINKDQVDISNFKAIGPIENITVDDYTHNEMASLNWISNFSQKLVGQNSLSYYQYAGQNSADMTHNAATSVGFNIKLDEYQHIIDSLKNIGIDIIPLLKSNAELFFNFQRTTFKSDYILDLEKTNIMEFGFQLDYMFTDIGIALSVDPRRFLSRQSSYQFTYVPPDFHSKIGSIRAGLFIQDNINLYDNLKILPGLRYDYYSNINKGYFSPRFSASFSPSNYLTIKAGTGLFFQSPGYEKIFNVNPDIYLKTNLIDLTEKNSKNLLAEKAFHLNTSFDIYLSNEITLSIDLYSKKFYDLIVPKIVKGTLFISDILNPDSPNDPKSWSAPYSVIDDSITSVPVNDGKGSSNGFEIILRKEISAESSVYYGWISYAYASAKRIWNNVEYPFNLERKHNFCINLGYKIIDWADLNLAFQYSTGFPITAPVGYKPRIYLDKDTVTGIVTPKLDYDINGMSFDVNYGKIENLNKSSMPDYHRLDFRITIFPKWFNWDWRFYLDIINVYNNKNIVNRVYYIERNTREIKTVDTKILPILPTLGFTIKF